MENIFFKTYIFSENIRKKFKFKIPLFSSKLYLDWIYLDSSKQIEHILVKRRGRFLLWNYFLIVKNYDLEGRPRKIVDEINYTQYISYKENSICHIHKKRRKFSFIKDNRKYAITYDVYGNILKNFSVITVTGESQHSLKYFHSTDIVNCPSEECILSGLDLIYYLQQKRLS